MNNTLIKCENLTKIYGATESAVHALRGINLTINQGENLAIVGPSGSGKSTLLQILGCLDLPTSGKYFLNSKDITSLSDDLLSEMRNTHMGFVFQAFHLFPSMSLLENVALPLYYQNISKEKCFTKAMTALSKVKLDHRASHKPHQLSGGERQRGAIARAIVTEPQILFADEPTGNLDSVVKKEILDYLLQLSKTLSMTLIMVTHDEETSARMKRILHIKDGTIYDDYNQ